MYIYILKTLCGKNLGSLNDVVSGKKDFIRVCECAMTLCGNSVAFCLEQAPLTYSNIIRGL